MSKETYPIVCPSCGGRGYISNPEPITSVTTIPCPACQGSKVVVVTKEDKEGKMKTIVDPECSPQYYYILTPFYCYEIDENGKRTYPYGKSKKKVKVIHPSQQATSKEL